LKEEEEASTLLLLVSLESKGFLLLELEACLFAEELEVGVGSLIEDEEVDASLLDDLMRGRNIFVRSFAERCGYNALSMASWVG